MMKQEPQEEGRSMVAYERIQCDWKLLTHIYGDVCATMEEGTEALVGASWKE
jgi:hypothetical protein